MVGAVKVLSLDSKGTHVVQKSICKFSDKLLEFVFEETYDNFFELVTNNHGLCMTKKLLAATHSKEKRAKFMALITEQSMEIMQNQYGNYAITEIL